MELRFFALHIHTNLQILLQHVIDEIFSAVCSRGTGPICKKYKADAEVLLLGLRLLGAPFGRPIAQGWGIEPQSHDRPVST